MSDVEHDKHYAHRVFGVKHQSFRFRCNGTSDPTDVLGEGVAVTFDAVNVWDVAFDGAYRNMLTVTASVAGGNGAPRASVSAIVDGPDAIAKFKVTYLSQDPVSGLYSVTDVPVEGDDVWVHVNVDFLDIGGNLANGTSRHHLRAWNARAAACENGKFPVPGHW
jgi:hypothetical protein